MSNIDNQVYTKQPSNFTGQSGSPALINYPLKGIVKSTIDSIRTGQIWVYIKDFGALDENNYRNWTRVRCLTPFYGKTNASAPTENNGSFDQNPHSYGMWHSPPDIGTEVICIFLGGDVNYGYYIGSIYSPEALHMVPAIGSATDVVPNASEAESYGGALRLPVVNINPNDPKAQTAEFLFLPKPIHSYQAYILRQQGLIRDSERGTIGTNAQRETPSRVGWGVSTPGRPIYQGGGDDLEYNGNAGELDQQKVIGRRGGHSIIMDDGDVDGVDQLVRIRTSLGHQILLSDSAQTLFIIHSNGDSWIELGKEGTIDMYATNSVNIRTQGDLNLHSDNNMNLHAKKNLNIFAENINAESEKSTTLRVGQDYSQYTVGKYTLKVNGATTMTSAGEYGINSGFNIKIKASPNIYLNTGTASLEAKEVKPIPQVAHTDTLDDPTKGWAAAPGKLLSVTSRAPAHQPWLNANQGVDVKVNNSAGANLPTPPSPPLAAANAAAPAAPANPVTPAVAATVPSGAPKVPGLDSATSSALQGAKSVNAAVAQASTAAGAVASQVSQAAATAVPGVNAVGALGLNPTQLAQGGVLKPGADQLVNKLVSEGKSMAQATAGLTTGLPGAGTVQQLASNVPAQVNAMAANLSKASGALQAAGVLSGKESPQSAAGAIFSAATQGVSNTIGFIQNSVANNPGGALIGAAVGAIAGKSPLGAVAGAVAGAMAAGKNAAGLAANAGGLSLGGLGNALGGAIGSIGKGLQGAVDAVKGVTGAAFSAITNGFGTLQANVPQNLTSIAISKEAAGAAVGAAVGAIAGKSPLGAVAGAVAGGALARGGLGGLTSGIGSAVAGIGGAIGSAVSGVAGAVGSVASGVAGAVGSVASGIAGGVSQLASGVSNALSTGVSSIPGGGGALSNIVGGVSSAAKTLGGAALNAVSQIGSGVGGAISSIGGGVGGAIGGALGSVGGALGKVSGLLKQGGNTLQGLASSSLPPGLSNQLNAAIGSIGSGGSVPIKVPTVAVGTIDRSQLQAAASSALATSKAPLPNFSGVSYQPKPDNTGQEIRQAQQTKVEALKQEYISVKAQKTAADTEATKAKNELLALRSEIEKVSDEEYEQRGLGQKFKELKETAYQKLEIATELASKLSTLRLQLIDLGVNTARLG